MAHWNHIRTSCILCIRFNRTYFPIQKRGWNNGHEDGTGRHKCQYFDRLRCL